MVDELFFTGGEVTIFFRLHNAKLNIGTITKLYDNI